MKKPVIIVHHFGSFPPLGQKKARSMAGKMRAKRPHRLGYPYIYLDDIYLLNFVGPNVKQKFMPTPIKSAQAFYPA